MEAVIRLPSMVNEISFIYSTLFGRGTALGGDSLTIAEYCMGQAARQVPHLTHFSWSITFIRCLLGDMASTVQVPMQASQERSHFSGSM